MKYCWYWMQPPDKMLDGTAKGGIVLAIAQELKLPVKLVGLGESMEDLRDFSAAVFTAALFEE